jgi:hypothetical protein
MISLWAFKNPKTICQKFLPNHPTEGIFSLFLEFLNASKTWKREKNFLMEI